MSAAADNPFRVQRIHELHYRLLNDTWDAVLARLAQLDYHAAVVGPHGHGKSTFLRALTPKLEANGFQVRPITLNRATPRIHSDCLRDLARTLGRADFILLDGCEQLGPWAWRRFRRATRHAGGLLITSHTPGRLPTLMNCRTTPELLRDLLAELHCAPETGPRSLSKADRLSHAEGDQDDDESPLKPTPNGAALPLFQRHQGNLRAVFFDLYDQYVDRISFPKPNVARSTPR